jgi:hypothetical protein
MTYYVSQASDSFKLACLVASAAIACIEDVGNFVKCSLWSCHQQLDRPTLERPAVSDRHPLHDPGRGAHGHRLRDVVDVRKPSLRCGRDGSDPQIACNNGITEIAAGRLVSIHAGKTAGAKLMSQQDSSAL